MPDSKLGEKSIQNVKALARDKLLEYHKVNDVIGAQIFSILEKESKVLYYPLEDRRVWGFFETIKGKSFVCINTSLQYDKQVFVAAHELYHLWYGSAGEVIISKDTVEPDANEETELLANRFAAEFLVDEGLLYQEMRMLGINKDNLNAKEVVRLANHFVVPYHSMSKRLHESGACSLELAEELESCSEEQAEIWRNRLGISIPVRKEKIGLTNLFDTAMEMYERGLITYEKLEYLLSFSGLTPGQMGVEQIKCYIPPTDDELDAILEE